MLLFGIGKRLGVAPLLLALLLVGVPSARADEPPAPKDDALDRLLEKLDESSAAPKAKPDAPDAKTGAGQAKAKDEAKDKDKDKAKDKDQKQAQDKADATKAQGKTEGEKAKGDVAPKDQALDNLLEKLGETKDRPDAQDERRGGRPMPGEGEDKDKDKDKDKGPGNEPMPPKAEQPDPGDLTGKDKTIDERLEELTGRKRKKKQGQDEDGSGPLSQVIKEMREVEQRLGKTDTGEETRKRQTEIVRNIDQLIEQLRNSSSQSRGKQIRTVSEAGQKPGSNPGQTPGANAGGAPNTKPAKPESKHAKVGSKDEWGHLPPELQQERAIAGDEEMLAAKQELIRLYFLSVSKKKLSRGE
jgi:hypothetical protein